jgi:pimeloyl-ACP methyl ester carboxylesterase
MAALGRQCHCLSKEVAMKTYSVSGGAGIKLHVQETGNPDGKPILFIHGFSQCRLAWNKQLHSDLGSDFRLVAMDLRGHGLSDRPADGYAEPKLWADDVHAVITSLGLNKPLLAGWSYGGIVVSDYLAMYGEDYIAGSCWIGAVSRLGEPLVRDSFLGSEFLALIPGFFSENASASVTALEQFVRLCVHEKLAPEDLYFFLGFNTIVPSFVRRGLFARNLCNDNVIEKMRKPMLLMHGEEDKIVMPSMSAHIAGLVRHASQSSYPKVGHAPFWEAPQRFNHELRKFRESI